MPVIAYVLARVTVSLWEGPDSASLADAGVALESGLTLLAAAVGAAVAAYLALTGYAMLLGAAWRGGRAIPKALVSLAPHGWTRVTATALGLSMTAGLAVPALATEGGIMQVPSAGWVAAPASVGIDAPPAALAIGWVAANATASPTSPQPSGATSGIAPSGAAPIGAAPIGAALIGAETQPSSAYVVQPGDSLWHITEALLGADASAAHIAASWPALYEANRDSIGDNPSLIQPGLALTVPAGFGA
jgi:hypothetical protein